MNDPTRSCLHPAPDASGNHRWRVNGEDLPGNFLLARARDPQEGIYGGNFLGIYRNVFAAAENCAERSEPGIGAPAQDLATWLTGRRGLETTEPQPVTIGGLDGFLVDVTLAKRWTTTCPVSEGKPVVPLIIGSGVFQLHHVIYPGMTVRLYLLATEDGTVVIEVAQVPGQGTFTEYLGEVVPILQSAVGLAGWRGSVLCHSTISRP